MSTKPNSDKSETPSTPIKKPEEIGGRGGLDPVRYGDWEIGGIAKDF
jgi:hypothetical protein